MHRQQRSPPAAAAPQPGLHRAVSRWQIVGLSLNDVVGSGVYLLPAAAAAVLGAASLQAVIVAGAAVLLIVLCFAEAAGHFDQPGGAYLYARTAFGDGVGFAVGWMTWLTRVAATASLAVGFAQAVGYAMPVAHSGWGRVAWIVLPLLALTWLNVLGIRTGVGVAMLLVGAKLAPLLLFVAAGVLAASPSVVASQTARAGGSLGEAALLLLFAYAGFENTPAAAGEYRRPQRDVPFALLTQVGLVTALYVSVQWVALGTLPDLGASATPLADAAGRFLGGWAGTVLTFGAAAGILGTQSNSVLAGPRYLLALARDGYGPSFLTRIHPRYRTPTAAILFQTAIALPLALTGSFAGLAAISVVARLVTYAGTAAAIPVLRRKMPRGEGFRMPGGALLPALAVAVSLALAASATLHSLAAAGGALAVGAGVFLLRRRSDRTAVP